MKEPIQNLLGLLLLLMLVMRIVLATVCCRIGSPGLVITLNFCSDFEHFCLLKLGLLKIFTLDLVEILMFC